MLFKRMKELIQQARNLVQKINQAGQWLDIITKKIKIKALNIEMNEPDFWKDQEEAKKLSQKLKFIKDKVDEVDKTIKNKLGNETDIKWKG